MTSYPGRVLEPPAELSEAQLMDRLSGKLIKLTVHLPQCTPGRLFPRKGELRSHLNLSTNLRRSFIYRAPNCKQPRGPSAGEGLPNWAIRTCRRVLLSNKKKQTATWMNLQGVMLSAQSQPQWSRAVRAHLHNIFGQEIGDAGFREAVAAAPVWGGTGHCWKEPWGLRSSCSS